jgi:glycerol-3-phosphate dehydrogenase (NAD(P)+)
MKVTTLGAGSWGTALAVELNEGGHDVTIWGRDPMQMRAISQARVNERYLPGVAIAESIRLEVDFEKAVNGAEFIVMAVPSKGLRETARRLREFANPVVSVTKGIEHCSGLTMTQALREEMPRARVAALSGPTFAPEVARRMPSAAVVASADAETARQAQELFHRPYFRIYTNQDVLGVELGGALKNVIAIAAGVCDGLGFGDNSKAALVTRALAEISRLGLACGARPGTFSGLSGLGDLTVTCFSRQSRNRALGERVGKGEKIADILPTLSSVAEGYPTALSALELARKLKVDAPIIEQVHAMLYENKAPREALRDLVSRDSKSED